MGKKKIHTVYDPALGKWNTILEGQKKPLKTSSTKRIAMKHSIAEAKRRKTEHVIHNKNGRISDSDSYGNDPYPPRDRRF